MLAARLSLPARLVALLLAALLPLSAFSVWMAVRQTRSEVELVQAQLSLAASLIAASQDNAVDSARELLAAVAGTQELRGGRERCQAYFERLRDNLPAYANIGLLNPDGSVACHANGRMGDFSAADRPYFRAALEQRRFVMGPVIQGRASGRWSIPFAQPVVEEGNVTGVVFAALDLERATQALAAIALPAGARVTVSDRLGQVLMQHPASPAPDAGPEVEAAAASRQAGEQGFLVRVALGRDRVTATGSERLRESLLVLALTLMGGALGAWWLGGRTIVKPARQILGVVRRLEHGHLDARVPVHATALSGEFGRIAAAFNLMAESLEVRQGDLEAELRRSQAAYSVLDSVVNSMGEGLIAVDGAGRLLLHNQAAGQVFNLERLPAQPAQWTRHLGLLDPGTGAALDPAAVPLARAMRGERGQQMLLVRNAQAPDGRLLLCSYEPLRHAEGGGGLIVFADITESRRLEADLVLLRNAVARLNDVVLITEAQPLDEPGPRIVFANEAFERLTGHAVRDAIGRSPRMLQGPGTDRAALDRIRHALEQGLPVREELVNYRRDGTPYWIELDIVPLGEGRGRYTHLIAVQRDVTARKESERALAELNASLEARIGERTDALSATNRELEAFSYSVSHDLRAPLAAIGGFAQALAERADAQLDERGLHFLSRIRAGVARMEQLIAALLSLSKVSRAPVSRVAVDLGALAREALDVLQLAAPERQVEVAVAPDLVAEADPDLLRLVLDNLVGNAWKFTAGQPLARIEVGRTADGAFYVRDNGVGFDMAQAGQLFAPFQRLHSEKEFPGTGIGLATVQRAVLRHGGRVWAESQPGTGSAFYFTLG